jgi:hypothetical protein
MFMKERGLSELKVGFSFILNSFFITLFKIYLIQIAVVILTNECTVLFVVDCVLID